MSSCGRNLQPATKSAACKWPQLGYTFLQSADILLSHKVWCVNCCAATPHDVLHKADVRPSNTLNCTAPPRQCSVLLKLRASITSRYSCYYLRVASLYGMDASSPVERSLHILLSELLPSFESLGALNYKVRHARYPWLEKPRVGVVLWKA